MESVSLPKMAIGVDHLGDDRTAGINNSAHAEELVGARAPETRMLDFQSKIANETHRNLNSNENETKADSKDGGDDGGDSDSKSGDGGDSDGSGDDAQSLSGDDSELTPMQLYEAYQIALANQKALQELANAKHNKDEANKDAAEAEADHLAAMAKKAADQAALDALANLEAHLANLEGKHNEESRAKAMALLKEEYEIANAKKAADINKEKAAQLIANNKAEAQEAHDDHLANAKAKEDNITNKAEANDAKAQKEAHLAAKQAAADAEAVLKAEAAKIQTALDNECTIAAATSFACPAADANRADRQLKASGGSGGRILN